MHRMCPPGSPAQPEPGRGWRFHPGVFQKFGLPCSSQHRPADLGRGVHMQFMRPAGNLRNTKDALLLQEKQAQLPGKKGQVSEMEVYVWKVKRLDLAPSEPLLQSWLALSPMPRSPTLPAAKNCIRPHCFCPHPHPGCAHHPIKLDNARWTA